MPVILRIGIVSLLLVAPLAAVDRVLPTPAAGELASVDSTFDSIITRILLLTEGEHYAVALAVCDSLRQALPDHPGPYLSTAGVYVNRMQSYRLNDFQAEVDSNAQRAIDTGVRMLAAGADAWLSFYVGSAYGYRGMARLRRHNWVGAFLDGRRSIEYLNTALELDPRLYDAYFVLGAYHYWRTARSSFLRAVAFWMPDRRDLGLQQIRLAAEHGRYIRTGALHGLALALYDTGDIAGALAANTRALAAIDPPTTGSLYIRGRLLVQLENWPQVEQTFRQLLNRLPPRAVGYQVECKYWIARALNAQGRTEEARQLAISALAQSQLRRAELEVESALEDFATIRQWLATLLEQNP